jgi:hypothetical protein
MLQRTAPQNGTAVDQYDRALVSKAVTARQAANVEVIVSVAGATRKDKSSNQSRDNLSLRMR